MLDVNLGNKTLVVGVLIALILSYGMVNFDQGANGSSDVQTARALAPAVQPTAVMATSESNERKSRSEIRAEWREQRAAARAAEGSLQSAATDTTESASIAIANNETAAGLVAPATRPGNGANFSHKDR